MQCPAAGVKISENPKCQLHSCRDSKKESVKNPGNSGFFHRPFSVLHFLIVSSFVCAFLVPCGGRVLISVQQQQQCQQQRVNALWRASPISTARKERGISHEHAVSMPYIRLLPFLQMAETKTSIRQIVCQCPTSGFSHFYIYKNESKQRNKLCVNALHRASPISTMPWDFHDNGHHVCVNALHRASPISTNTFLFKVGKQYCVNALHRASPISTRSQNLQEFIDSVSMPYIGLLPFLQYPLKNLIKSNVYG